MPAQAEAPTLRAQLLDLLACVKRGLETAKLAEASGRARSR